MRIVPKNKKNDPQRAINKANVFAFRLTSKLSLKAWEDIFVPLPLRLY
jgi:hypothetical protein